MIKYTVFMLLCWFLCVVERPTMPTLEDGVRSWPTWLSARSPRNRPQELMRMLETLDSRCWPLLTRLRKPKNLMPKSLTEDLRWWPSSACFPGGDRVLCACCFLQLRKKETPQRVWLKECNNVEHQHNGINMFQERNAILCQFVWRSELMKFISCQPRFQPTACLVVWYCSYSSYCYIYTYVCQ